jgi:curved DNA-binding protein CbpA
MEWREIKSEYVDNIKKLEQLDAYTLLGISPGATRLEIKSAYREKVKLYHPDRSDPFVRKYSQEVTKLLNQAYRKILSELADGS